MFLTAGTLNDHVTNMVNMNIFSQINTGYQLIDMLISTCIMLTIPILYSKIRNPLLLLENLFTFKNKVTIVGTRSLIINWHTQTQNTFSTRFRAIWHYIHTRQQNNNLIYSLKEYPSSENQRQADEENEDYNTTNNDIFIVDQRRSFLLEDEIWCRVQIKEEVLDNGNNSSSTQSSKCERIIIELYSKQKSVNEIKTFIDSVSDKYIDNLYKARHDKLFIYSLDGFNYSDKTGGSEPIWNECRFNSTRHFNTIFFDKKRELLGKLDFFENNRSWYENEGHPYTLGIALHGPPGTGKTSVIKCIANQLQRHLIVVPLSKIKTQTEFNQCFFDDSYSHKNAKYGIGFEKKIIVFEDIDCMSDIILDRSKEPPENKHTVLTKEDLFETIKQGVKPESLNCSRSHKDELTLSFILNVIDGIRETPGRIMIVTSNHYDKLDKAFTRPGRIDLSLEMKNASIDMIDEIVQHYYKKSIPRQIRQQLRDGVVSPAALINLRFKSETSKEFFDNLVDLFN